MHLSMLSPREEGGGGVGHGVGIVTFLFKNIPHPWDKIIGQNVHLAASEGGKMSFVLMIKIPRLGTSRTIQIPTLWTDLTIKLQWSAQPPLLGA